jgi:hypothetical protein
VHNFAGRRIMILVLCPLMAYLFRCGLLRVMGGREGVVLEGECLEGRG